MAKETSKQTDKTRVLERVSIVVPAYNEEMNLPHLYDRVSKIMGQINADLELIIVENGSDDGSLEFLRALRLKDKRVNYLSLTRNFGHQGALIAGLEHARGGVVITMDADLQHPPEIIPGMLKLWSNGFDVVYSSKRNNKNRSLLRRSIDKMFYALMNKLTSIELRGHSDFRLMDRRVVDVLRSLPEKNKFLRGLTSWVGFKQVGVEYDVVPRFSGNSKFNFKQLIKLAIDGIFSFSIAPLRMFTTLGVIISLSSFAYGIYCIGLKVYSAMFGDRISIPPGWVTLSVVVLFFGGIQLLGIGLLGEYIGRIYDEVKDRPSYIVQESSFGD